MKRMGEKKNLVGLGVIGVSHRSPTNPRFSNIQR